MLNITRKKKYTDEASIILFLLYVCAFVNTNQQSRKVYASVINYCALEEVKVNVTTVFIILYSLESETANRLWICTSKISSIPQKRYTSSNAHFSYTVIYEHTYKTLLTLKTQDKHKWEVTYDYWHVSRVCLQSLPSQWRF